VKVLSTFCLCLFLSILGVVPAGAANVAVDSAGNSYSFIYMGAPSYSYSVVKVSPLGERIFLRPLDLPLRWPTAIAVDPAGSIYIAGTANFVTGPGSEVNDGYEAFVIKLTPDATGVIYDTFFVDRFFTHGLDLAVDALGQAYLHYTSGYGGYASVAIFSPAGSFIGWYAGSSAHVTAMALGPSGDLFTVGWVLNSESFVWEVYLGRMDTSSGAVIETLVDRETLSWFVDVAATPGDGSVVVGMKSEGLYVAEFGPAGEELFSRILNLGEVQTFDVAVTSSGEIVINVHTRSGSFVLRLEGGTGEVISSMNRPPDCSAAFANPGVIWPPNGKMVPVSIPGVTDPEGDPVSLKVTGISQDEPGTAYSGIGSSVAQVKAERDGRGNGRVYRIQFEAVDPSGASCTGEVTACVPHDRGKESCVDGNR
jgi:hypothetical protein